MKKIRIFGLIALAVICMSVMTGCSRQNSDAGGNNSAGNSSADMQNNTSGTDDKNNSATVGSECTCEAMGNNNVDQTDDQMDGQTDNQTGGDASSGGLMDDIGNDVSDAVDDIGNGVSDAANDLMGGTDDESASQETVGNTTRNIR